MKTKYENRITLDVYVNQQLTNSDKEFCLSEFLEEIGVSPYILDGSLEVKVNKARRQPRVELL